MRLVLFALCLCTAGHSAFAADARCADAERNTQYWIFGDNTVYASWRRLCREGNSAVDALLGALNGNPGAQATIRACISEETAALSARNLDLVCEQIATGRPAVRASRSASAAPSAPATVPAPAVPAASAAPAVIVAARVAPTGPAAAVVVAAPATATAPVVVVAPAAPTPAVPAPAESPKRPARVAAVAPASAASPAAASAPPSPTPAAKPEAPKADLLATLQGTWCWKNSSGAQGQNTFSGNAVSVTEIGNLGLADSTLGKLNILSNRQFQLEVSGGVQKLELIDHDTIKWQDGTVGRRCNG
jgi:hypothetical protein